LHGPRLPAPSPPSTRPHLPLPAPLPLPVGPAPRVPRLSRGPRLPPIQTAPAPPRPRGRPSGRRPLLLHAAQIEASRREPRPPRRRRPAMQPRHRRPRAPPTAMDPPPLEPGMADRGRPWSPRRRRTGATVVDLCRLCSVSTPLPRPPSIRASRLVPLPPVDDHGSSGGGLENLRRPLPSSGAGKGGNGREAPACLAPLAGHWSWGGRRGRRGRRWLRR
ncbi:unnamed protein product, partial [Urochloa humidicola]